MVAAGYKETEVGLIPEDWAVDTVGNCASVTTGAKDTQDRIPDGRYPFFVRSPVVERINTYSYDGEAVLTAGDGVGTGKVFHYIDGKFDFHQRVYKVSDFKPKLNGFYFFKVFSDRFYDRIMSMTAKSSVDSVRREMIVNMLIPLPDIDEQKAIAAALSDVDALIESLEKLIAKKRAIKTGTMQQLLTPPGQPGHKRLPGFSGAWHAVNMGRDAVLKARIGWQALTTAEYRDTGTHYLVTGTDFWNGKVRWDTCCFVSKWRYDQDHNIQLRPDDVLLTKDGTIGKVGYVDSLPGPATLNSGVFVIRPLARAFNPHFLFYVLTSRIFIEFLLLISAGSTINHLYQKDFTSFSFLAPEEPEQQAIAEIFSDIDEEIEALEARLEKTKAIKQGMMQELLTGRIRLV